MLFNLSLGHCVSPKFRGSMMVYCCIWILPISALKEVIFYAYSGFQKNLSVWAIYHVKLVFLNKIPSSKSPTNFLNTWLQTVEDFFRFWAFLKEQKKYFLALIFEAYFWERLLLNCVPYILSLVRFIFQKRRQYQ